MKRFSQKQLRASETNVLTFAVRRMNLYDRNLPNPLANVNLKDFITFPNTAGAKQLKLSELLKLLITQVYVT